MKELGSEKCRKTVYTVGKVRTVLKGQCSGSRKNEVYESDSMYFAGGGHDMGKGVSGANGGRR